MNLIYSTISGHLKARLFSKFCGVLEQGKRNQDDDDGDDDEEDNNDDDEEDRNNDGKIKQPQY